ncbi:MAG: glutamate formiminotransferase [Candidatus Peregrinibacteria bacterium]
MRIVECVPNFSEGKDKKIISKIANSIKKVPNIKLLDIHKDPDHNRSVMTFTGTPEQVIKAAFNATKTAASLIDLTKHKGQHPRTGATDVIPLIPLKGITFEELIPFAENLGDRITDELNIPVILYEKAAKDSKNKNLALVRKRLAKNPSAKHGTTVVGVRDILIAFNVNLKTDNLNIAKQIAKSIREKDGGLKSVKALGLPLPSRKITQVSMNLVNYKQTPPLKVFQEITRLAKKLNTEILESELVGLIPKDALPPNPEKSLKLKKYKILSLQNTQKSV